MTLLGAPSRSPALYAKSAASGIRATGQVAASCHSMPTVLRAEAVSGHAVEVGLLTCKSITVRITTLRRNRHSIEPVAVMEHATTDHADRSHGMLCELGLSGMASAYHELEAQPEVRSLEHGEWLALLLEREATKRRQKRFEARARAARLRHDAQVENIDFRAGRGLDRQTVPEARRLRLDQATSQPAVIRPAGVGKSRLACALGHTACREDFFVAYHRLPRPLAPLALAR